MNETSEVFLIVSFFCTIAQKKKLWHKNHSNNVAVFFRALVFKWQKCHRLQWDLSESGRNKTSTRFYPSRKWSSRHSHPQTLFSTCSLTSGFVCFVFLHLHFLKVTVICPVIISVFPPRPRPRVYIPARSLFLTRSLRFMFNNRKKHRHKITRNTRHET